jgi:hypothetical protein
MGFKAEANKSDQEWNETRQLHSQKQHAASSVNRILMRYIDSDNGLGSRRSYQEAVRHVDDPVIGKRELHSLLVSPKNDPKR